jgi:hypothetical protein
VRNSSGPRSKRKLAVEGQRTEGVAFRVIARGCVDADDLCRYGAWIDATPRIGTDVQHAGTEETVAPATAKGSRGRTRLLNSECNGGTSLMRLPSVGGMVHVRQPKGPDVFVPEGLIDSSLAVYCLGRVEKAFRPVRDGMIDLRGS